jgi:cytidylate kinase
LSADPKHLERLLERQGRLWELRRALSDAGGETARERLAHLAEGPWVTLSKQVGCGGVLVGRAIAERLGWQVFDREILDAISREAHTVDRVTARLDGRAVGVLEDYLSRLLVPGDPGQPAFVRQMMRAVWAIGRQGQAVLLGRGANWVLDPRFGLRVRAVAPKEQRIACVARDEGLDPAAARRRVDAEDDDKARFIRQVYRQDIDDPLGYDLTLNLGALDVDTAAETIVAALTRKLRAAS